MSSEGRRELALLVAAATVLGVVDSMVPRPLPFLRLGLANIPAIIVIIRSGFLKALELNFARVTAVALVTGTIATPAFLLSASGAAASTIVMAGVHSVFQGKVSLPAVSASGAVASLWAQLFIAGALLSELPSESLVPVLSLWGTVSGAITGMAAAGIMRKLPELEALRMNLP